MADVVVDCTGDADVAYLSGAAHTVIDKNHALGVTSVFNAVGVQKDEFLKHVESKPATYQDWSNTWEQETDGKENHLKSPYLDNEFNQASKDGAIPEDVARELCGSGSALSEHGEATNLNLVHQTNVDVTNVRDLTAAEMLGRENTVHALNGLKH